MPSSDPHRESVVLRVEIVPEQVAALGGLIGASPSAAPAENADLRARQDELARREAELRQERSRLDRAARDLAEREASAASSGQLTASEKIRLAQRLKHTGELEQELEVRSETLEERAGRLDLREAEFEADVELREEKIECWRSELTELDQRLKRREAEVLAYVAEVQEELIRRENAGWQDVAASIRH